MPHEWPTLATPRTRLRALADSDLEFVFEHFSDSDVGRYLVDAEPLTSRAGAQEIIEWSRAGAGDPRQNRWAIVSRESERAIGTCGFHKWDKRNHMAEIGFDLSRESWRSGIMTEVLAVVLAYGFAEMDLNRIEALVHVENQASCGLLRKLDFQREGTIRDRFHHAGAYHDHHLFSLLRSDRP